MKFISKPPWETCISASRTQTHIKHINPTCSNLVPCVLFRLSPEERAHVEAQLDELTATYNQLCDSSTQQLQQLEQQLAKEEERKVDWLEMERGYRRYMTKNVFLAFASWTKCCCDGTFIKCCFESEYACKLSVSSCVGQQECVLYSMLCVHRVCIFDKRHHYLRVSLIDLVWFNKHHRPYSDVYSGDLKMTFSIFGAFV